MRLSGHSLLTVGLCGAVGSCAAVSGLDQLKEVDCVGCGGDASMEASTEGSADAGIAPADLSTG
jgi:hypothetical protein